MRRQLSACVGLMLLLTTSAWAQLASQTALVGTVTDSGGADVSGAQVVAVNVGTADTYEVTTNNEGYYNVQFAKPGRYEITVSLAGFAPFKATGVEVATNQVVRTNATLKVGALTDAVTVEAKAQVLDTDRPTVCATINERAVVELPLNGRNVWNLAATTPGVLGGLNSDIGLSFRGAGQREIQNSLSLDGINSTANLLAATSMKPIADAVTEVQVQTGSHVGRIRRLPRRRRQRGDQERDQQAPRLRLPLPAGRQPRLARLLRQPGAAQEPAVAASSSARSWTAPS